MTDYIHQLDAWPNFKWDGQRIAGPLASVRHEQGRLIGRMEHLRFPLKQEASVETLTLDVLKSSEIEGEKLNEDMVRSSIARRLGVETAALQVIDCDVEGVVEMMLDATGRWDQPFTAERLFAWHASLFPTARSGMRRITVGGWRTDASGPMQVVSGPLGRQRVHFEAPQAGRLQQEMEQFLAWFNSPNQQDWVLNASIAHLWFVTIHPFDDGNGRIARAVADMCLARSEKDSQRFYSMSAQIRRDRERYYQQLEKAQHRTLSTADLDITPWILWFFDAMSQAIEGAQFTLAKVLAKARFWESLAHVPLNERQRLVLSRLVDGFEGKLTTTKWAKLTHASQDTAARDIHGLLAIGILKRNPEGGRSTSFALTEPVSAPE